MKFLVSASWGINLLLLEVVKCKRIAGCSNFKISSSLVDIFCEEYVLGIRSIIFLCYDILSLEKQLFFNCLI